MIHTIVTFHVPAGKNREFEAAHRALLKLISTQPGCIDIKVHHSLKESQEYVVYGTWESKQAWEGAHKIPEFKPLFEKLPIERHTLSGNSFMNSPMPSKKVRNDQHRELEIRELAMREVLREKKVGCGEGI